MFDIYSSLQRRQKQHATDLQINGSMLLKRNKIFELILKSLSFPVFKFSLYFPVISSKNFDRKLL